VVNGEVVSVTWAAVGCVKDELVVGAHSDWLIIREVYFRDVFVE
jgi:hypothetical protein